MKPKNSVFMHYLNKARAQSKDSKHHRSSDHTATTKLISAGTYKPFISVIII